MLHQNHEQEAALGSSNRIQDTSAIKKVVVPHRSRFWITRLTVKQMSSKEASIKKDAQATQSIKQSTSNNMAQEVSTALSTAIKAAWSTAATHGSVAESAAAAEGRSGDQRPVGKSYSIQRWLEQTQQDDPWTGAKAGK